MPCDRATSTGKTSSNWPVQLDDLARRTREGRADLEELQGGTFTVTNLGSIGGTSFTPIVNFPEVAILGMGRSRPEPTSSPAGASSPG